MFVRNIRAFLESKKALLLLLSIAFIVALIAATKDSIKNDEFIVLKYILTGQILNLDSQVFHLFLYKIVSFVFGISTLGLRALPIFLYVVLIYVLYKWGSEKNKTTGLMFGILFLSNSYLLDYGIYAHSYVFYLLFAAIIFYQLEKMETSEQIGPVEILKGGLIGLLGVCSHLFFYLIVLYQILVLGKNRKKINRQSWIIISLLGLVFLAHLAWIGWPIINFRKTLTLEGDPPPYVDIFQAFLGYINWNGRYNQIPSGLKVLLVLKTLLYLFIMSKAVKSKHSSSKIFLFLSVLSLVTFLTIKNTFSIIEVDYRYFIFWDLLFLNFALKSSAINKKLFALFLILNLFGLVPYLSKNFSGSNEKLMSELKIIYPRFKDELIYTDNEYYYKQGLSSLFQRETRENIDAHLVDINQEMKPNTRINIILFDPDYQFQKKYNVLFKKDLSCPECDGDLRELIYLEIMVAQ